MPISHVKLDHETHIYISIHNSQIILSYRKGSDTPSFYRCGLPRERQSETKEAQEKGAVHKSADFRIGASLSPTTLPLGARARAFGADDLPDTDAGENLVPKPSLQAETTHQRTRRRQLRHTTHGAERADSNVGPRWAGLPQSCRQLYIILSTAHPRLLLCVFTSTNS